MYKTIYIFTFPNFYAITIEQDKWLIESCRMLTTIHIIRYLNVENIYLPNNGLGKVFLSLIFIP